MLFEKNLYRNIETLHDLEEVEDKSTLDAQMGGVVMKALLDPEYGGKMIKENGMSEYLLHLTKELRTLMIMYRELEENYNNCNTTHVNTHIYLQYLISKCENYLENLHI